MRKSRVPIFPDPEKSRVGVSILPYRLEVRRGAVGERAAEPCGGPARRVHRGPPGLLDGVRDADPPLAAPGPVVELRRAPRALRPLAGAPPGRDVALHTPAQFLRTCSRQALLAAHLRTLPFDHFAGRLTAFMETQHECAWSTLTAVVACLLLAYGIMLGFTRNRLVRLFCEKASQELQ